MEEKITTELNQVLRSASLSDFNRLVSENIPGSLPTLCEYLNKYIATHNLITSEIVKDSMLSRDYAYSILNGNKSNPNRDRVIALCIAMHMNLDEIQRALEISNAGILYSKNPRDMAIIICINTCQFNIKDINQFLFDNNLELLHTSREV